MAHLDGEAAVVQADDTTVPADNGATETTPAEVNYYPDDLPANDAELPQGDDAGEAGDLGDDDGSEADDNVQVEAPQSLNEEERTKFAALPPEAQEFFSATLQRREVEAQQGVQKVRDQAREIERTAADTVAQTQQGYARQFDALVNAFAPQPPPAELARQNPAEFWARKAEFDDQMGQFQQLVQQVKSIETEASQHFETQQAQWKEQRSKTLMSDPVASAADPGEYLRPIIDFGVKELGYEADGLGEHAEAQDILNIRRAMRWKADADRWANHQRKRNQRPREAKTGQFQSAPAGRAAVNGSGKTPLQRLYPDD